MRELARRRPAPARHRRRPGDRRGGARQRSSARRRACARPGCASSQLPLPAACARGTFVAPTLIEIGGIAATLAARSVRTGAARAALPRRDELAALDRRDQRHRLRPDARHPHAASTRPSTRDPRAHPRRQRLRQPQHHRRGRRRAALRRAAFGHRPEGRRAALPAPARARTRSLPCRSAAIARCPAPPAKRIRSIRIRAAGRVHRARRAHAGRAGKVALALGNKVLMLREPIALAARDRLEPGAVELPTSSILPRSTPCCSTSAGATRAACAPSSPRRRTDRSDRRSGATAITTDAARHRAHGNGQHGGGRRQCALLSLSEDAV